MSVEYGAATIQDIPRIVDLKLAMFLESGHAGELRQDASEVIRSDYEQLYQESCARHFVARASGQVVACVGAFVKRDLPYRYYSPSIYGFVGDVYVAPGYRRQGLASRLTHDALAWLRSTGITTVRLLATESARGMYERMGFAPSDEMVLRLKRHITE